VAWRNSPNPFHDATFPVTQLGRICFHGRKVNLSHVFAGQNVGVTQVGEHVWLVTFMRDDLGYFDDETCRLEPIEIRSPRKCLPMSSEWTVLDGHPIPAINQHLNTGND
jgi:putative transposase